MGDLSKNFSRDEFACRCGCGKDTVDVRLLQVLQLCADDFKKKYNTRVSITITGPNRCDEHNDRVGGAKSSQHLVCKATDIKVKIRAEEGWYTVSMSDLYDYFDEKYPNTFGIGLYKDWVHIDVRSQRARWGK